MDLETATKTLDRVLDQYRNGGEVCLFETYVAGLAVSMVVLILLRPLAAMVSRRIPAYHKLEASDKVRWDNLTMSFLHAIISTLLSLYAMYERKWRVIFDTSAEWYGFTGIQAFTMFFSSAYMLYDFYYMLVRIGFKIPQSKDALLLLHHLIVFYTFYIGSSRQPFVGAFFCNCWLFLEATTPFLNLRFFLAKMKLEHTLLFQVNQILFAIGYFLVRIVFNTMVLCSLWLQPEDVQVKVPVARPVAFVLGILQYYWFIEVVQNIIKGTKPKKPLANGDKKQE